jgi:hypothetical protein
MNKDELISKLIEELKWYKNSYHRLIGKTNGLILRYSIMRVEYAKWDPNFTNDDIGNRILKDLAEGEKEPFPNGGVRLDLNKLDTSS